MEYAKLVVWVVVYVFGIQPKYEMSLKQFKLPLIYIEFNTLY